MQAIRVRCRHQTRRDSVVTGDITFVKLQENLSSLLGIDITQEKLRYFDNEGEWIDFSSDRELREALRLNNGKVFDIIAFRGPRHVVFPGGQFRGRFRGNFPENQQSGQTSSPMPEVRGPSVVLTFTRGPVHPNAVAHPQHPFGHGAQGPRRHGPHCPHRAAAGAAEPFRHPAKCDSCDTHIVGLRHKCNECADYDLCGNCIGKASEVHPNHTFTALERSFPRWHHRHAQHRCGRAAEQPETAEAKPETVTETVAQPPVVEAVVEETKETSAQEEVQKNEEQPEPLPVAPAAEGAAKPNIMDCLRQLEAMGFNDKQKNVRLVMACGGDMAVVLEQLLDE